MTIVIFGGSGGIGSALVDRVSQVFPDASLFATWCHTAPRQQQQSASQFVGPGDGREVQWSQVDLASEASIQKYSSQFDEVHWIINAVGVLHSGKQMPEKSLQQIEPEYFMHNMQLNALPALLIAKHFRHAFKNAHSTSVPKHFATVSAKVGSIEDNRLGGWYSYRCSKAALNMAVKNISIEWQRTVSDVCVTALHPGTTETALSEPFRRNIPDGKLFKAAMVAERLVDILLGLTSHETGRFITYDGEVLPW